MVEEFVASHMAPDKLTRFLDQVDDTLGSNLHDGAAGLLTMSTKVRHFMQESVRAMDVSGDVFAGK